MCIRDRSRVCLTITFECVNRFFIKLGVSPYLYLTKPYCFEVDPQIFCGAESISMIYQNFEKLQVSREISNETEIYPKSEYTTFLILGHRNSKK